MAQGFAHPLPHPDILFVCRLAAAKVLARPRMDEMRANFTPSFGNPCGGSPPCVPGQTVNPWETYSYAASKAGVIHLRKRMALRHNIAKAGDRIIVMAGVPFGTPGSTNVLHIVTLTGEELHRFVYPSVAQFRDKMRTQNDGTMPSEPPMRVSQVIIEPVLKAAIAEANARSSALSRR